METNSPKSPQNANRQPTDSQQVFAEHFVKNQHRIYGYVVTLIGRRSDADEVFQQTCLALWQSVERFDVERDFFAWACGIARNQVKQHWRKNRKNAISLDEDVIDQLSVLAQQRAIRDTERGYDRIRALRACLATLSDHAQKTIQSYYLGSSVEEIAVDSDRSSAAVYKVLARIRQRLHRCVQQRLSTEVRG